MALFIDDGTSVQTSASGIPASSTTALSLLAYLPVDTAIIPSDPGFDVVVASLASMADRQPFDCTRSAVRGLPDTTTTA